jgi:hypothetical protein
MNSIYFPLMISVVSLGTGYKKKASRKFTAIDDKHSSFFNV